MTASAAQVTEWLAQLSKIDARLWLEGDRLNVSLPGGATLAAGILDGVRAHFASVEDSTLLSRQSACLSPLSDRRRSGILICVHPVHGDVYQYVFVAAKLAPRRAVYGLQALGLLLEGGVPGSVPELVDRYVRELIDSALCDQEFVLYGVSSGGFVALEIARRLAALGKPPRSVVLGDTRFSAEWAASPALQQLSAMRFTWLCFISCYMPHAILEMARPQAEQFWGLPTDEQKLEWLLRLLRTLPDGSYPVRATARDLASRLVPFSIYLRAHAPFASSQPYDGRTLYLRAGHSNMDVSASTRALLTGDTRVAEIDGTHQAMLQAATAGQIASLIDREFTY